MFIYDDETQSYYSPDLLMCPLHDLTMADILLMLDNGEIDL